MLVFVAKPVRFFNDQFFGTWPYSYVIPRIGYPWKVRFNTHVGAVAPLGCDSNITVTRLFFLLFVWFLHIWFVQSFTLRAWAHNYQFHWNVRKFHLAIWIMKLVMFHSWLMVVIEKPVLSSLYYGPVNLRVRCNDDNLCASLLSSPFKAIGRTCDLGVLSVLLLNAQATIW